MAKDIYDHEYYDYESGARKLEERPNERLPDITKTGDKADEPKKPYGLTQKERERGSVTRQDEGQDTSVLTESDAEKFWNEVNDPGGGDRRPT